jgi:hypothetical protein
MPPSVTRTPGKAARAGRCVPRAGAVPAGRTTARTRMNARFAGAVGTTARTMTGRLPAAPTSAVPPPRIWRPRGRNPGWSATSRRPVKSRRPVMRGRPVTRARLAARACLVTRARLTRLARLAMRARLAARACLVTRARLTRLARLAMRVTAEIPCRQATMPVRIPAMSGDPIRARLTGGGRPILRAEPRRARSRIRGDFATAAAILNGVDGTPLLIQQQWRDNHAIRGPGQQPRVPRPGSRKGSRPAS